MPLLSLPPPQPAIVQSDKKPLPEEVQAVSPSLLWGRSGFIWFRSTDGGKSWQTLSPPFAFASGLPLLTALDSKWVLASSSSFNLLGTELALSKDGGRTWQSWKVPQDIFRVVMETPQRGAALGGLGDGAAGHTAYSVLRTTDGGQNWTQVNASASGYLNYPEQKGGQLPQLGKVNDLHFLSANTGFLAGVTYMDAQPYLYRTTDGGKNFAEIGHTLPLTQLERGQISEWWMPYARGQTVRVWVRFASYQDGHLKGEHLTTFVSHDSGRSWTRLGTRQSAPSVSISAVVSQDGLHGLTWARPVANDGTLGKLHLTRDGGKTWQAIDAPFRNVQAVQFTFADVRHGWALAFDHRHTRTLWHTQDGGLTWQKLYSAGYTE